MKGRSVTVLLLSALLALVGGGCGVLSNESNPALASLDVAEEELIALGEVAFGSDAVEVAQVDSCRDQPALVRAVWNVADIEGRHLRDVIVAAAEQAGWAVQVASGQVPRVRRSIDGVEFALIWTVGTASDPGGTRVTLMAQWADKESC